MSIIGSIKPKIKFIDLFAGLGGTRIGFENACHNLGLDSECVFTSEIKDHAIKVYKNNFNDDHEVSGDICEVNVEDIPDFDYLLGGFPCQPFSSAGKRLGFYDTRGTLFFRIEKILKEKQPDGFLLENVEGLTNHDKGKTLQVILTNLTALGYNVVYKVLNASDHGVPQDRKRIYILGNRNHVPDLENLPTVKLKLKNILESGKETLKTDFTTKLINHIPVSQLHGKSIKDKRGGSDNIHSWDFGLKGEINQTQKRVLEVLLLERRKRHWAEKKGIDWMDGMPLTYSEISMCLGLNSLFDSVDLRSELDDLVQKGYLKFEYPKKRELNSDTGQYFRTHDSNLEKGYNIVTGKLSFEINKILDPEKTAPTIVATDANKLAVVDGDGIRKLTIREGLRLFGFPEEYNIDLHHTKAFDLLGNTVVVPVIEMVSERLLSPLETKVNQFSLSMAELTLS